MYTRKADCLYAWKGPFANSTYGPGACFPKSVYSSGALLIGLKAVCSRCWSSLCAANLLAFTYRRSVLSSSWLEGSVAVMGVSHPNRFLLPLWVLLALIVASCPTLPQPTSTPLLAMNVTRCPPNPPHPPHPNLACHDLIGFALPLPALLVMFTHAPP